MNPIQQLATWLLPVLLGITVHEVAHGWVALKLGDSTAQRCGRLTLNPLKHVDLVGTILVPAIALALSGFIFGWAKPVPVTWSNLRQPKRDMALVALAGPGANLLMAMGWTLVLRVALIYHDDMTWMAEPLIFMSIAGIFVNSILLVLNLVPLPPLDGGRILTSVLPLAGARKLSRIEPFGILILVVLLVSGALGRLIEPFFATLIGWFVMISGLRVDVFDYLLGRLLGA